MRCHTPISSIAAVAISPSPGRRHGADRRLPYRKEENVIEVLFMLALVVLLMVIDQMRR